MASSTSAYLFSTPSRSSASLLASFAGAVIGLAGLALAWARALGEFGATITFAGNLAGRTRTLPLEIFLALESDPESAVAVSVLLLSVSFAVLVVLRGRWFSRD